MYLKHVKPVVSKSELETCTNTDTTQTVLMVLWNVPVLQNDLHFANVDCHSDFMAHTGIGILLPKATEMKLTGNTYRTMMIYIMCTAETECVHKRQITALKNCAHTLQSIVLIGRVQLAQCYLYV
jgi:hypothetical protein